MLYHLLYPLYKYISGFNIFRYITFRTAAAVIISLSIFFIFGNRFIKYLIIKTHGDIRKFAPDSHLKKKGTPSMGGLLIIMAVMASVLICGNFANKNILVLIIGFLLFGLIGFVDDYLKELKKNTRGLAARFKLISQIIVSAGIVTYLYFCFPFNSDSTIAMSQITIPFLSGYSFDIGILYIPFGVLVLVASSNTVNITDGLDGLAIGLTLFVVLGYTAFAYLSGHFVIADYLKIPFIADAGEITVFCGALAGACLGFLWFNSHPAQVFMGDTGALSMGGIIGLIAILLKKELLLILIGGVFVMEGLSVILQILSYKIKKKRIFKMAPIHHHFEMNGLSESKIIIRFWILGALLALVSIASLKIR